MPEKKKTSQFSNVTPVSAENHGKTSPAAWPSVQLPELWGY